MEYIIQNRNPLSIFRFFEEICAIPHPSYHEERIADYLVEFAKTRSLEYVRDEWNNVLIKKPATQGQEHRAPLLFQGHTDMVCEKNSDVEHNFLNDPLKLFLDGDFLGAEGTTLGGDDGIAVAMMLALLDGEVSEHPAIECLFTVAEEVGLNGAHNFDYTHIKARKMINLDSEELGIITAGCAGGIRSELTLPNESVPFEGNALQIHVGGLAGGHSGCDIHCGRANANKLMGRLLATLSEEMDFHILTLEGGSKDNAIPRECECRISVDDGEKTTRILQTEAARIAAELCADDANFFVALAPVCHEGSSLSKEATMRAVSILACAANGVLEMNYNVSNLVEYSRNLGVIHTTPNGITFIFSARSAIESRLDASVNELNALARITGCTANHHSRYPGWNYAPTSNVRKSYIRAYRDVTGEDATVNVIHAGLECGIIYSKMPDMDIISIGPNMKDIHSPNERLDLSSVELFWKTLVRLIEIL